MTSHHIDLDYVIAHCEQEADQHKLLAVHEASGAFSSVKDERKRDEHMAKSQMADQLAEHFRNGSEGFVLSNPEVDALARQIDPDAFDSHDALVARMIAEGSDESYALQVARTSYGDRMDAAQTRAGESIQMEESTPDLSVDYDQAIEDVSAWHERRALEAERLEQMETTPARRHKYAQRAKRHRLYARHIRHDFAERRAEKAVARAKEKERQEPELPLVAGTPAKGTAAEEGVPLEVQRAFLRKTEVMDDEGW